MHKGTTYEEQGEDCHLPCKERGLQRALLVMLQLRSPTSATSHLARDQDHEQTHLWLKPGACDLGYGILIRQHPLPPPCTDDSGWTTGRSGAVEVLSVEGGVLGACDSS